MGFLVFWLIFIQFSDSCCSELYDKIQSLYLKDLLMVPQNIELEEATVLLNSVAIPFYVIAALAPMAKILVDYLGKKKVLILSFGILMSGAAICMTTDNWLLFLLGNSLVSFGCSVDIQYIYIVDELREERRGTVRGVLAAVAAMAGMVIAFTRNGTGDWRKMYLVGIILVAVAVLVTMIWMPKDLRKPLPKATPKLLKEKEPGSIRGLMMYLLPLFFWGIGVAAVTFYNEPIVSMTLNNEDKIQTAMILQPIITMAITLVSGYLSDRLSRKKVIVADILIAIVGTVVFVITGIFKWELPVLIGVTWGMMIGGFFAATNLMLLVVTEKAPAEKIGRVAALSSYFNGAGTGVGMVIISVLGKLFNTGLAKLILIIPVGLITLTSILLLKKKAS